MLKTTIFIIISIFHLGSAIAINMSPPSKYANNISAIVLNAQTGKIIYSTNADIPRLVASNMKLVTTMVALDKLKPNFQWHTKLAYDGSIHDGVLHGNVYLIGGGDPTLDNVLIDTIMKHLKLLKINKINGNIIVDNSIFNSQPTFSMLKKEHYDSDTTLPNGINIDGNLSSFKLKIKGKKTTISSNLYQYKIINHLRVSMSKSDCSNLANEISVKLSEKNIIFRGNVPHTCNGKQINYNMLNYRTFIQMILNKTLNHLSINLHGYILFNKSSKNITPIYDHTSQPLQNVLIEMNKFSINLYAEAILLSLGAYTTINTNTYTNATQVYLDYMAKHKLLNSHFKLENGAGLSRTEYMQVNSMAQLLMIANASPFQKIFIATLPISGQIGTLKNYFTSFGQRVLFKTGTLNDTRSYAGYFYSKNKTKYIIVATINNVDMNNPLMSIKFNAWVNRLLYQLN